MGRQQQLLTNSSQLREIDARSLAAVRLVSRRLCAISTPIKYESLRLTEDIVAPEAETCMSEALKDIFSHTKHVEVLGELEPEHVKRFLARIHNLKTIRWKYQDSQLCSGGYWLPSDVLKSCSQFRPRLRLSIEDLPLEQFSGSGHDAYLQAIPALLLVSLKAECRFPLRTPQLDSLKRLLIASKGLEKLNYNDKGQGTRFSFCPGETMPPLSTEARAHWDFSRLRKLVLVDVPLNKFLSSVPASSLGHLRHLECGDFNHGSPEVRRATTAALASLIDQIQELDELKIICHTTQFPIDVLLAHGQSLRSLRYRDHVGFTEDDVCCPTLTVKDLSRVSRGMPCLESIELDWEGKLFPQGPREFLSVLCQFPQLRNLTLHVQTLIDPFDEDVDMEGDKDLTAAGEMFKFLVREAEQQHTRTGQGSRLKWERITINVGGWRPVQMRRLGAAWRERNRLGTYAERCFVFERLPPTSIAEYNMFERSNIRE
ncbi:hypothetical protein Micbo1qcDRAFT_196756 [Microdochium bolleyi]|uniref:F-box domain-containing protein n=1 Tax=Microdochium bolleyi TaxID=196109 RepID=A0A136IWM7_9PEZI|nr:hypothetical protein Micbo1qcDRAFT_196756 [Microdochium bolleyi]